MKLYNEEQMKQAFLDGGLNALRMKAGEPHLSPESYMMEVYPEMNLSPTMINVLAGAEDVAKETVPEPAEVK